MSYHDLLYCYGSEQESAEIRPYTYIQAPQKLTTLEKIARQDKSTAEYIRQLEAIIADLKDYRQALAARYGELETMPYTMLLKLERCPHWKGNIEYIITITKTYGDGTAQTELREVYPGKDRRKAIARYQELRKQRPGIESEMDIEKRSWER